MNELLPCPHCGSVNVLVQEKDGGGYSSSNWWEAECFDCDQTGKTRQEAIDKWNTRTLVARQPIAPYKVEP